MQLGRTTAGTEGLKGEGRDEAEKLDRFGRQGGKRRLGGTINDKGDLELGRANIDERELVLDDKDSVVDDENQQKTGLNQ